MSIFFYETTFMYLLFSIFLLIQFQALLIKSQNSGNFRPVAVLNKVLPVENGTSVNDQLLIRNSASYKLKIQAKNEHVTAKVKSQAVKDTSSVEGSGMLPSIAQNQGHGSKQLSTRPQAPSQPSQLFEPLSLSNSSSILSLSNFSHLNPPPNLPTNPQAETQFVTLDWNRNTASALRHYRNKRQIIVKMVPRQKTPKELWDEDGFWDECKRYGNFFGNFVKSAAEYAMPLLNNAKDTAVKIKQQIFRTTPKMHVENIGEEDEDESFQNVRPFRRKFAQLDNGQKAAEKIAKEEQEKRQKQRKKDEEDRKKKKQKEKEEYQRKKKKQLKLLVLIGIPVMLIFFMGFYNFISGENPIDLITGGKSGFGGKHVVVIVMIILTITGAFVYLQVSNTIDITDKIFGKHKMMKRKRKKDRKRNVLRLSRASTATSRASGTSTASCIAVDKKWEKYMKRKKKKGTTISNAGSTFGSLASVSPSTAPLSMTSSMASSIAPSGVSTVTS